MKVGKLIDIFVENNKEEDELNWYSLERWENEWILLPIYDGSSGHVAHAWRKIAIFRTEKIWFVTALDLIGCLNS